MADTQIVRKTITDFIISLETARTLLAKQTLRRQRIEMKRIDIDRQLVTFEANTTYAIITEVNSEGKSLYSNESLRKCAIQKVLDLDKTYQAILHKSDKMKKVILRLKCEEDIAYATIQRYEALQRLYFYDLESEVKR